MKLKSLQFFCKNECEGGDGHKKRKGLLSKKWSKAPENCTLILYKEYKKMYLWEKIKQ